MMMNTRTLIAFAGAALLTAGAQAGFTTVQSPFPGEASHAEILGDIFGGTFVQNGNDFSNGAGVVVTRVDDDNDQTYDFASWSAEALASWSCAGHGFGTAQDGSLLDIAGMQFGPVSGSINNQPGGSDIKFARFGSIDGTVDVTTDPGDNPSGNDHVVTYTYSINDVQQADTYLLFFEDLPEGNTYADFDYNDLVVQITGSNVPEPSSLALIALGGAAMLRRRR